MKKPNQLFKKNGYLSYISIIMCFFSALLYFQQSNAADIINQECIKPTSSQVHTNGLDLHIPYALVNNTYYHAQFNYIGNIENVLTWKLSSAIKSVKPLPNHCSSTVSITDNQVFLADVVAMKNTVFTEVHYDANLILISNNEGTFLKLLNYSVLPKQVKLIMAVAGSEKKITLAWELKEDTPNDIKYLIHAASEGHFKPDKSTLIKTIQDIRQIELNDLTPDTEYFFKIITEDKAGLQSIVSNTLSVRTFRHPLVLNPTVSVKQENELNLSNPIIIDEHNLSFALTGKETVPTIQSILQGKTTSGGYLRKIESITQSNEVLHLTSSQASLSDVFDTGSLSHSILLTNISENTQSKKIKQWKTANNSVVSKLKWDNDLLEITQTNHSHKGDKLTIRPAENGHSFRLNVNPDINKHPRSLTYKLSPEVSIDASIDFEPTFETEIDWVSNRLNSAKVKAGGTLSINLAAELDFKGQVNYISPIKRILTKTYKATYLIGSVPVVQVTTFTLDTQVSAKAKTAIHATTNANASTSVSLGVVYNNNDWSTISSPISLERSITADMSVKGKVNAEIRLIPNIETRFYELTSVNLSVEPFLEGEIASEPNVDLVINRFPEFKNQLKSFDIGIGLECFTDVNFKTLFGTIPILEKTKICGEGSITGAIKYPLFSLPKLSVTSKQQATEIIARANVINGTNNPFDMRSVYWFIEPTGPVINTSEKTMRFTPSEGVEEYKIFFSGYGKLGEKARQVVDVGSQSIAPPPSDSTEELSIVLDESINFSIDKNYDIKLIIPPNIENVGTIDNSLQVLQNVVISHKLRRCDVPTPRFKHAKNSELCLDAVLGAVSPDIEDYLSSADYQLNSANNKESIKNCSFTSNPRECIRTIDDPYADIKEQTVFSAEKRTLLENLVAIDKTMTAIKISPRIGCPMWDYSDSEASSDLFLLLWTIDRTASYIMEWDLTFHFYHPHDFYGLSSGTYPGSYYWGIGSLAKTEIPFILSYECSYRTPPSFGKRRGVLSNVTLNGQKLALGAYVTMK